jgi:hypothetical protein
LKDSLAKSFEIARKENLLFQNAFELTNLSKKEMAAMKLDGISWLDDVQPVEAPHLISGFTELGWVDPYSSDPSNPEIRSAAIKKLQAKLQKEEEERQAKLLALKKKQRNRKDQPEEIEAEEEQAPFVPRMSFLKFPSAPLLFKMMRACVDVQEVDQLWIYNFDEE